MEQDWYLAHVSNSGKQLIYAHYVFIAFGYIPNEKRLLICEQQSCLTFFFVKCERNVTYKYFLVYMEN